MIKLYITAINESFQDLIRNWRVLIGLFVLISIAIALIPIFSSFGIIGGFLVGLMIISILSYYYSWVSHSKHKKPIYFSEMKDFNMSIFNATISVAFILWIAGLLIGSFAKSSGSNFLPLAFNLLLIILLNPIPEIIYNKQYDGLSSIKESIEFTKNRWIEWLFPLVIIYIPILTTIPETFPLSLSQANPLLPASAVYISLSQYTNYQYILPVIFLASHWYMLFRARLFDKLQ